MSTLEKIELPEFLAEFLHTKSENQLLLEEALRDGGAIIAVHQHDGNFNYYPLVGEEAYRGYAQIANPRGPHAGTWSLRTVSRKHLEDVLEFNRIFQLGLAADATNKAAAATEEVEIAQITAESETPAASIDDLDLSIRYKNALWHRGIRSIADTAKFTKSEMLDLRNIGPKLYEELRKKLIEKGFGDPDCEEIRLLPKPAQGQVIRVQVTEDELMGRTSVDEEEAQSLADLGLALKDALHSIDED